jgi:ABC-type uncharacterized transport system substrate-binding protein
MGTAGRALATALPCLLDLVEPAEAHPHVFADAMAEIRFDDEGRIVSVHNSWRLDEAFSAFAIDGIDKDGGAPARNRASNGLPAGGRATP